MKTNRQRELAFLQYLDALDSGDSEGINHFLEEAQEDERLEKMMLDYHQQKQAREAAPIDTPVKTIVPFKLKREQTRHMIQIVGTSAVAALILITVGVIGLLLGMRQNNTAIADAQECTVSLANEDNTVTLIGGDDIESPLHVGVNNPFTVYLNTGQTSEGYQVIFEGLRSSIAHDDLVINGDCSQERVLTVYPHGEIGNTCEIQMEPMKFLNPTPGLTYQLYDGIQPESPYFNIQKLVVFDQISNGLYPIVADNLKAGIPTEAVHLTGDCPNYPLLYVPPRFDNDQSDSNTDDTEYTLQIDSIKVREQRFEYGVIFYLEPVNKVWVALQGYQGRKEWLAIDSSIALRVSENPYYETYSFPDNTFPPEAGILNGAWRITATTGFYDAFNNWTNSNWLGGAISEPVTYMATYSHPTIPEKNFDEYLRNGGSYLDFYSHYLESSTGEVYQFYEDPDSTNAPNFSSWRWNIVSDKK